MAIIGAGLKLAKKLLQNKSLQKAINVTTTQSNKLKEAAKAGASAAGKATVSGAGKATKAGAKKALKVTKAGAKKALKATTKAAKKASKVTGAAAVGAVGAGAKKVASTIASKVPESVRKAGVKTKDLGNKIISDVDIGATAIGRTAKSVGAKGLASARKAAAKDPFQAGMVTQGLIDIPLTVGAVALTASMVKSSTPKESLYDVKKQPDGKFMTSFNDPNKNKITSTSQLSSKEMGIVRGAIAGLDAILLSEDPRKERAMFNNYLAMLSKYGVSSVNGKNLSVNIAG